MSRAARRLGTVGIVAAGVALGCGTTEPSESLVVTPTSVTVKRDSTVQLQARVEGAKAGAAIAFASADTAIAQVTAAGVVRGIRGGATTVLVTSGGLSVVVPVVVLAAPPASAPITQLLSGRPFGAAVSSQGVVYVTRLDAESLGRATLPSTAFTAGVRVRSAPTSVAFDTSGTTAYVANQLNGHVGVVNASAGAQGDSIGVPGDPALVRVSPHDGIVWVTTNVDSVYGISRVSRTIVERFSTGVFANGIAFHPTNDSLVYVSTIGGTVHEINHKVNVVRRTLSVGGAAQGIAVSDDGAELYVANEATGALQVWRLATATADTAIALSSSLFDLQLSPDGTQIWVSALSAGRVYVVSRATRAVVRTIDTGGTPSRIAFDRFGTTAVVANQAGWVDFIR